MPVLPSKPFMRHKKKSQAPSPVSEVSLTGEGGISSHFCHFHAPKHALVHPPPHVALSSSAAHVSLAAMHRCSTRARPSTVMANLGWFWNAWTSSHTQTSSGRAPNPPESPVHQDQRKSTNNFSTEPARKTETLNPKAYTYKSFQHRAKTLSPEP